MDSVEPKKTLIIRIYQILEEYSDEQHPLKQQDIIDYLGKDYGIACERKAVARNIRALCEAGYEIYDSPKVGYYLAEKTFSAAELKLLIDGVLCSRHIPAELSKPLMTKLVKLGGKYFKDYVKNVYSVNEWNKTENKNLFDNIESISEAIKYNKKIAFTYNKYGTDKKLHPSADHTASPYLLLLHNQRYYLMAKPDKWGNMSFYRLDRITNVKIRRESADDIKTVKGYENGINYRQLASAHPYMFGGKPTRIELECEKWMADELIDWFGFDIRLEGKGEKIKAILYADEKSMLYWIMQYSPNVKVVAPESLRERLKENLLKSLEMYQ